MNSKLLDFNLQKHIDSFERFKYDDKLKGDVFAAAERISASLLSGGKLLLCGNGGSAADCQHIAAEFVGRFKLERQALPAIALHCNTSSLTAIGNDYSFDDVFARQVEAFAKAGDVLIGISTGGTSRNVIKAIERAKSLGCFTVMLTGSACPGSKADLTIAVPSDDTPTIQEMHIFIGHFISEYAEEKTKEKR